MSAQNTEREYILSDSSVNEYGFRLLTSGYQLDQFAKNPIGYYMHQRDLGVMLKWDNLRIDGDNVLGTPVINLSNARGPQTAQEVEGGFLNAASVGSIVVLEYSTDPEMMLAGQTGPTITKWYNKECSLVDVPGNCNALALKFYDAQDNEINLASLMDNNQTIMEKLTLLITADLRSTLGVAADATESVVLERIQDLASANKALTDKLKEANDQKAAAEQKVKDLQATATEKEVDDLLGKALSEGKVTKELSAALKSDYAGNPVALKSLLDKMPAYKSIVENLKATDKSGEDAWSWDEFEANDPSGKKLQNLKSKNPDRFKEIFEEKFGSKD